MRFTDSGSEADLMAVLTARHVTYLALSLAVTDVDLDGIVEAIEGFAEEYADLA